MPQAPLPPVPALQPSQAPMASQAPAPVWQAVQSTITDEAWLHWWFAIVFGCFWWFPSHQKKVFKKIILVTSWYQLHTHRWFHFSVFPLRLGVSLPQSPPWRCSSETLRCRSCAWILFIFFRGPELGQWWWWFLANKYSSYLLTFFCLDDARPCHDMELSLRNEDLPVDWESKMSQMLCFPSFCGVVGQPIVIAGHTRSGTASHVQVIELKMVGRLHAGSSRFDHGCDMRRWFNEIMLKAVCFV